MASTQIEVHNFSALSNEQKSKHLEESGEFLMVRSVEERDHYLFQLPKFYVTVQLNVETLNIEAFDSFVELDRLDPFLAEIDLKEFF